MDHGVSGISDERKFQKNTSEENLKHKNETKKNNRNIINEKDDKSEQINTNNSNNSSVNSQIKYLFFKSESDKYNILDQIHLLSQQRQPTLLKTLN